VSARAAEAGLEAPAAEARAILDRAAQRGRSLGVDYAGAVTPIEAHRLHAAGLETLVDVRTLPEWEYVGRVHGSLLIEWRRFREPAPNPGFLIELAQAVERDTPILFLCRSGVRSHHAANAAAQAGFTRAYNVLEGFEGDLDGASQRGKLGGWRAAGLPWEQG
jgi:rhodanese-related sulfurtransferase